MKASHRPKIQMLSEENLKRIVDEAFQTLNEVGVFVENEEAVELLAGSGARISNDRKRAFISQALCEKCIATVPSSYSLYDRDGREIHRIGDDNILFDPGSAAILV